MRRKKRKKNPFLDDEAELDGACSDDENDEDLDGDLDGFIDDSETFHDENFHDFNKKIEIELNRERLLEFLTDKTKHDLEAMGLRFVYSHPSHLLK